jgi:hypothetical protein
MDNVQFDENPSMSNFGPNSAPKMGTTTKLFIKLGLAKDQKQANGVMTVVSIVFLLIAAYITINTLFPNAFDFGSKPKTQVPTWTPPTLNENE